MSKQNKVATNLQQDFTNAEKEQARANMEASRVAIASSSASSGVNYTPVDTVALWSNNRLSFGTDNVFVAPYTDAEADKGKVLKLNNSAQPEWTPDHSVSYDASQGLSSTQQRNARHNINAMTGSQFSDFANTYTMYAINPTYRVQNDISWINVSSAKQYRAIAQFTVPAKAILFLWVNTQLVFYGSTQYDWAMCMGTTQEVNESTAKFFCNLPNIPITNVPTIPFIWTNAGDTSVNVYLGAFNHSGYPIDEAHLRSNMYETGGNIYGPTLTYEIRNFVSIKSDVQGS